MWIKNNFLLFSPRLYVIMFVDGTPPTISSVKLSLLRSVSCSYTIFDSVCCMSMARQRCSIVGSLSHIKSLLLIREQQISHILNAYNICVPSNQGAPPAGRHFVGLYRPRSVYLASCWLEPVAPQFRVVQWTGELFLRLYL